MVRKLGKPDLFVTVTCNPKWIEIVRECGGRPASTRPDVVARVFKMKLDSILKDITELGVLGKVKARSRITESYCRFMRPLIKYHA